MAEDTPMHLIHDLSTGEQKLVPYTPEEIQQRELDAIQFATEQAEREAKAAQIEALKVSARAKLVAGEALTEEEAAVITL